MEPIVINFACNPLILVAVKSRHQSASETFSNQQMLLSNKLEEIFLNKQENSGIFRCTLIFNIGLKNLEEKKQRINLVGKYQCQKPELAKLCSLMLTYLSTELILYNSHIVDVSAKKIYASTASIICTLEKV